MAQITITTTEDEQRVVLDAVKELNGKTTAVSLLSTMTKLNQSRVRYVLEDLEAAGIIKREVTKAFNKRHIRYHYTVL